MIKILQTFIKIKLGKIFKLLFAFTLYLNFLLVINQNLAIYLLKFVKIIYFTKTEL
jgi:hypothetical protein